MKPTARRLSPVATTDLDYWPTEPWCTEALFDVYPRITRHAWGWEPAAGGGHMAEVMRARGLEVVASDVAWRGYDKGIPASAGDTGIDFLTQRLDPPPTLIMTNPPNFLADQFVAHALDIIAPRDYDLCIFTRLAFLEGAERYQTMFADAQRRPAYVYVFSDRVTLVKASLAVNQPPRNGGTTAYAWFIWTDDPAHPAPGETVVRHVPAGTRAKYVPKPPRRPYGHKARQERAAQMDDQD